MLKKPEILAPAGSMDALKAAVSAGADAVYLGGVKFGARAYADNFDEQTLIQGIEYCHIYGVKVYLAINTLFRDEEILELYDYLEPLYCAGLDAVIVQDLGVVSFVHKQFPELPIHASTQMTITTPYSYEILRKYGVTRVVPARELSNEELKTMKEVENPPELEVFVQGALCYCYSGQCLMSSFLGGRSGNRGRCAQPCRLPYSIYEQREQYLLSPKDLNGLSNVATLIEMGIDSFKIEGRMKKPEYVAACVRSYRKVVDAYFSGEITSKLISECTKEMASVFNRGGFTEGYYNQNNGKSMMSMKQPGNAGVLIGTITGKVKNQIQVKLLEDVHVGDLLQITRKDNGEAIHLTCNIDRKAKKTIQLNVSHSKSISVGMQLYRMQDVVLEENLKTYYANDKILGLQGSLTMQIGEKAKMELQFEDYHICVVGDVVEGASKQPLSKEVVASKIGQLGNTRYEFTSLQINLSDNCYYSLKGLKELRRNAIEELEKEINLRYSRNPVKPIKIEKCVNTTFNGLGSNDIVNDMNTYNLRVAVSTIEQFEVVCTYNEITNIYLELQFFNVEDIIKILQKNSEKNIYILLPVILRKAAITELNKLCDLEDENLIGLIVRNLDELAYLEQRGYKKEIILDYSLYGMNSCVDSILDYKRVLPVELNERELENLLFHSLDNDREENCFEWIVYGYQQLMVSAQCIVKNMKTCTKTQESYVFKDRYKNDFYGKAVCKYCYNLIYNGLPTVLYDLPTTFSGHNSLNHRIHFTIENEKQIREVIDSYLLSNNYKGQRTKGHFGRGVE